MADGEQRGGALARTVDGTVVGLAAWRRTRRGGEIAEVSVVVLAGHLRQGLATALLRPIAANASKAGVRTWFGTMLSGNRPALGMIRKLNASVTFQREGILTTALAALPREQASPRSTD